MSVEVSIKITNHSIGLRPYGATVFSSGDGGVTVFSSGDDGATAVLEMCVQAMQGCGFMAESVRDAVIGLAEDYRGLEESAK